MRLVGTSEETLEKLNRWPRKLLLNPVKISALPAEELKVLAGLTNDETMAVINAAWRYLILCQHGVFANDPWDRFVAFFAKPSSSTDFFQLFKEEGWRFCYPEYLWAHSAKGVPCELLIIIRSSLGFLSFPQGLVEQLFSIAASACEQMLIKTCGKSDNAAFTHAALSYIGQGGLSNLTFWAVTGPALKNQWKTEGRLE